MANIAETFKKEMNIFNRLGKQEWFFSCQTPIEHGEQIVNSGTFYTTRFADGRKVYQEFRKVKVEEYGEDVIFTAFNKI